MKRLKKLMALLLAAIMTLAMATTAFAAGKKGILTVNVNDANNTLKNQTVSIYRLFDLTVSGDTPKKYAYTVHSKYKDILKGLLKLQETATDKEYYDAVAKIGDDNSQKVQDFADQFTEKLLTAQPSIEADKSTKVTGEETSVTFTDVPYGYYLVYQTGTKELQSSLVSVDAATKEITLKGEAPSIEKTADKKTVEIGQVVKYTITGTIPDTTGYADYQYIIHDTLTNGLDFVKNSAGEAITDNKLPVTITIQDGQSENDKQADIAQDNARKMTLDLSQWIQNNQTTNKGKTFTVVYYAKVNEKAVVTEKNSASLEYGNNSGETTTTTPVEKPTPTYPLDINKTNTDKEKLAGATFRLYKEKTDADAANDNAIKVTGQDGKYVVNPTSKNMDMVTVTTDLDGKGYNLHLNGLAAGTYYLVEMEAPEGYNKLAAPVKITITESGNTTVEDWTISKDDTNEQDKIIDIENTTGTILPGTGGMGTVIFTVAGIVLILGVGASFVISRRKRA